MLKSDEFRTIQLCITPFQKLTIDIELRLHGSSSSKLRVGKLVINHFMDCPNDRMVEFLTKITELKSTITGTVKAFDCEGSCNERVNLRGKYNISPSNGTFSEIMSTMFSKHHVGLCTCILNSKRCITGNKLVQNNQKEIGTKTLYAILSPLSPTSGMIYINDPSFDEETIDIDSKQSFPKLCGKYLTKSPLNIELHSSHRIFVNPEAKENKPCNNSNQSRIDENSNNPIKKSKLEVNHSLNQLAINPSQPLEEVPHKLKRQSDGKLLTSESHATVAVAVGSLNSGWKQSNNSRLTNVRQFLFLSKDPSQHDSKKRNELKRKFSNYSEKSSNATNEWLATQSNGSNDLLTTQSNQLLDITTLESFHPTTTALDDGIGDDPNLTGTLPNLSLLSNERSVEMKPTPMMTTDESEVHPNEMSFDTSVYYTSYWDDPEKDDELFELSKTCAANNFESIQSPCEKLFNKVKEIPPAGPKDLTSSVSNLFQSVMKEAQHIMQSLIPVRFQTSPPDSIPIIPTPDVEMKHNHLNADESPRNQTVAIIMNPSHCEDDEEMYGISQTPPISQDLSNYCISSPREESNEIKQQQSTTSWKQDKPEDSVGTNVGPMITVNAHKYSCFATHFKSKSFNQVPFPMKTAFSMIKDCIHCLSIPPTAAGISMAKSIALTMTTDPLMQHDQKVNTRKKNSIKLNGYTQVTTFLSSIIKIRFKELSMDDLSIVAMCACCLVQIIFQMEMGLHICRTDSSSSPSQRTAINPSPVQSPGPGSMHYNLRSPSAIKSYTSPKKSSTNCNDRGKEIFEENQQKFWNLCKKSISIAMERLLLLEGSSNWKQINLEWLFEKISDQNMIDLTDVNDLFFDPELCDNLQNKSGSYTELDRWQAGQVKKSSGGSSITITTLLRYLKDRYSQGHGMWKIIESTLQQYDYEYLRMIDTPIKSRPVGAMAMASSQLSQLNPINLNHTIDQSFTLDEKSTLPSKEGEQPSILKSKPHRDKVLGQNFRFDKKKQVRVIKSSSNHVKKHQSVGIADVSKKRNNHSKVSSKGNKSKSQSLLFSSPVRPSRVREGSCSPYRKTKIIRETPTKSYHHFTPEKSKRIEIHETPMMSSDYRRGIAATPTRKIHSTKLSQDNHEVFHHDLDMSQGRSMMNASPNPSTIRSLTNQTIFFDEENEYSNLSFTTNLSTKSRRSSSSHKSSTELSRPPRVHRNNLK